MPDATGIVLAGGRSTRFGGDKLAASYRGSTILGSTIDRVAEVCADVVVVLASEGEPDVPLGPGVRIARDAASGEGPLAGARAGLAAATGELALIVGGDMPDLQVAVLRSLVAAAGDPAVQAVALHDGERVRPLPCVVRVRPAVEAADALLGAGRRRLRELLDALRVASVGEAAWRLLDADGRTLFDVDEPGDLAG
ncbi:MAG: molybdenum cofactor guanylyltransferase [Actinomycetota bacterium]